MLGVGGFLLHLHAQAADVHVHNFFLAGVAGAPHVLQDIPPVQGHTGMGEEILHNLELHLGQLDGTLPLEEGPVAQVQAELSGDQLVPDGALPLVGGQGHPAVHRVHPGHQLRGGEGLGHVVVGAHHQAAYLVHFLGAGGEEDDADGGVFPPQLLAHRQAVVFPGHHDVQHGHVEVAVFLVVELQSPVAGLGLEGLVAGPFQVDDHKFTNVLFVLRNKDLTHTEDPPFSRLPPRA